MAALYEYFSCTNADGSLQTTEMFCVTNILNCRFIISFLEVIGNPPQNPYPRYLATDLTVRTRLVNLILLRRGLSLEWPVKFAINRVHFWFDIGPIALTRIYNLQILQYCQI